MSVKLVVRLKYRFSQHLCKIKNRDGTSIADHFNSEEHCVDDIPFIGTDLSSGSENYRKNKGQFWVNTLRTLLPLEKYDKRMIVFRLQCTIFISLHYLFRFFMCVIFSI